MAVLQREDIIQAYTKGDLKINPWDENKVEPASYDLALWGKILEAGKGLTNLNDGDDFILNSNTWASVASKEEIKIPDYLCATYGLRSGLTRRGLIYFGGPQIDPGYSGRIFVSVFNPTLEPINLRAGDDLFTLIFLQLTSPVTNPYDGPMQGMKNFPAEDVERMMRMRSKSLSDVIDQVDALGSDVNTLSDNLKILTGDVHEIKQAMDGVKPFMDKIERWGKWFIRGALFVGATVAIAAITYIVEQILGGVGGVGQ